MTKPVPASLTGLTILVVEDEFIVADDLTRTLQAAGANVLGPVPSVVKAMSVIATGASIDGAVLDIDLRGGLSFAVADALLASGVRIVFATGYDREYIPDRYAGVPRCEKPVSLQCLQQALCG